MWILCDHPQAFRLSLFISLKGAFADFYLLAIPVVRCPIGKFADRLASFAFNLGVGALQGSTLRRRVNAGDWPAAQRELMKWVRGGGRVLPGLVKRRAIEAQMLA